MQTFYLSLNSNTKLMVDNEAGRAIMALSFASVIETLDSLTKRNKTWSIGDSKISSNAYVMGTSAKQY